MSSNQSRGPSESIALKDPYVVTALLANVREEPSAQARIITSVTQGEIVDALALSPDGAWRYVAVIGEGEITGWVGDQYLAPVPEAEAGEERVAPRKLSSTVAGVLEKFEPDGSVTSWQIVREILQTHPEYGGGTTKVVLSARPPELTTAQPAKVWLQAASRLITPGIGELHGRMAILALAKLDPELERFLAGHRFLDALTHELREDKTELFVDLGPTRSAWSDPTPLASDWPDAADRLNRRGLARSLARRLRRSQQENEDSKAPSGFMMHVHGAWGSGKTSLLRMLGQELEKPDERQGRPGWVVVEFNAWKHQRLDPPWWFLMDAVYRAGLEDVRFRSRWQALRFMAWETKWRFFSGWRDALFATGAVLLVVCVAYGIAQWRDWDVLSLSGASDAAERVTNVLALFGTLFSGLLLFGRSMVFGAGRAAERYVEGATDPLEHLSRHFSAMAQRIGVPIFVFLDDLDRCQPEYVVRLLEGIQTLFNDRRLVYAVAADRNWLHACYEHTYGWAKDRLVEPGHRLGGLFLQKQFQLSVAVPALHPALQRQYWRQLLAGGPADAQTRMEAAVAEARDLLGDARSEQKLLDAVAASGEDPVKRQAIRQAAIERLADPDIEQTTELFLEPFAHLLEPNPRAMKRLLNAYAINRDIAVIGEIDVLADVHRRRQLALWTILAMRWPDLEAAISRALMNDDNARIEDLLKESQQMREVYEGEGVAARLDPAAIRIFIGIGLDAPGA